MKTTIKWTAIAIVAIISLSSTKLEAQDPGTSGENKTTFSLETDPSTFAFGGYALHIRIKPRNSERLLIGAGTYGMEMPAFMVNMNPDNADMGWNVRINSAYSLFGEYYLKEANRSWFFGMQLGMQNYKISNDGFANQENKYSNILVMPSVGYNWQPFDFPLYLKPWLGLGYTSKLNGNNTIDDLTYELAPLVPFVTLHVGYTI
jgi:hypothetical protein